MILLISSSITNIETILSSRAVLSRWQAQVDLRAAGANACARTARKKPS